ncbi:MAG: LacI family DNA-binding transcriptional regulator [Paracoccaceae bacterium]
MVERAVKKRVTQRHLAEQLGISTATVSLALRGSPEIADATRIAVREAMDEAGYVYNAAAASLRTGLSRIVGVSFHDIIHPFFSEMLVAIEDRLSVGGRVLFINHHRDEPDRLDRFMTSLRTHRADGLIVSPPLGCKPELLEPLRTSGSAIVFVSRYLRDFDADFIGNADIAGMKMAARHLLSLGHRHIVMLGGRPGTTSCDNRLEGFRRAILDAGLEWRDDMFFPGAANRFSGHALVQEALQLTSRPTAIVCFNDLVAFGAINGLRAVGLRPGLDAAVVGIDGTEEARISTPALTTVSNHPEVIGRRAAELLLERLENPSAPYRAIEIEPELTIRDSCGGKPRHFG